MKCVVSHPNIAPYIKQSVIAYQEKGMLQRFYTSYYQHADYPFSKTLIRLFPALSKEFRRRNIDQIEYRFLKGNPIPELLRVFAARFLKPRIMNRIWQRNEVHFDCWVAADLRKGIQWVHTYEHAALATIRKAKLLNIPSFYEQPSQHHSYLSKVLKGELVKYPELKGEVSDLMNDRNAEKCNRRKDLELKECDYIICNSNFTFRTLEKAGVDLAKVIMIPLGFPQVEQQVPEKDPAQKVTFLFAGNQNIRKGVHVLFKAWKICNFDLAKAELIVVGKNHLPASFRQNLPSSVKFIPNLPQDKLNGHYRNAHVFVLPTLADGFGMVISEAMAKGLTVLTTTSSGGPDIIRHRVNGLLVEAGDVLSLATQLKWCFDHPNELAKIGNNALETARAYPWSSYRDKLRKEVLTRVKEHHKMNVV